MNPMNLIKNMISKNQMNSMKPSKPHLHPLQRLAQFVRVWTLSLVACAAVLGLPAFAQSNIEALTDAYNLQNKVVASGQSRIIFYRPIQSRLPGATTIYVNGRYHTSLVAGGFSALCLASGNVELGIRQIDLQTRPNKDGFDSITQLNLPNAQNVFVRVQDQSIQTLALMPVQAAEAAQEVAQTRLQAHTISRVTSAVDCVNVDAPVAVVPAAAAPAPVAPVAAPRQMQLAGDTLFAFGRSDVAGLTADGLRAIDQLMGRINAEFSQIDRVHIVGHTDPFGSAAFNDQLSTERAHTVGQYLLGGRQINDRITSEGRGMRELLVSTCPKAQTPASIACNQPNRRVTVEITGTARQQ